MARGMHHLRPEPRSLLQRGSGGRGVLVPVFATSARETTVSGVITSRHLLLHGLLIVKEFGVRCFVRCVWRTVISHDVVTFLECI
jgi:hypothetical protein